MSYETTHFADRNTDGLIAQLDEAPAPEAGAALIAQEARNFAAKVFNGITTRKSHPTYGITKATLLADLHRLEGLLFAYQAAAHLDRSALFIHQAGRAAETLGIDLDDLYARYRSC